MAFAARRSQTFDYDARNEVLYSEEQDTPCRSRDYFYDAIGNRYNAGGMLYGRNSLNQYHAATGAGNYKAQG